MSDRHFKLILELLDEYGLTFEQWTELYLKLKLKPRRKEVKNERT